MIVALQGGLANQMFQCAFGLSVAQMRKEDVFFTRFRVDNDVKRSYSLGAFNVDPQFVNAESDSKFYDGGSFNPEVYTTPNTTFIGYWQTERYFDARRIRECFSLRNSPSSQSLEIADKIRRTPNSTFIHVRRGDYISEKHTSEFHGNLSALYYAGAMNKILQAKPDAKFFIFSDDPQWCRSAFPDFEVIDFNRPGNGHQPGREHEDIWLMAQCEHAIIANSAFSWWGAWLGDTKENRMVIAPQPWFQNADLVSNDIVPDRWIKL
jgi:hypothetical protein